MPTPTPGRLQGRVLVVTGAGGGIGAAYAHHLAEAGAKVFVTDLDDDSTAATLRSLEAAGHVAAGAPGDITDAARTRKLADHCRRTLGPAEALVNNAAVFSRVTMSRVGFEDITEDEWDLMMRVNLKGTWLMSRAFVPHMRELGRGKIVNISSGTAFKGTTSLIHYVTSKAGVLGFTRSLARELGPDGITVNCIAPGSTLTPTETDAAVNQRRGAAVASRAIPRVQTPEDLLGAVLFFCSPESDFVTGQSLVVDGGSVMP